MADLATTSPSARVAEKAADGATLKPLVLKARRRGDG